MGIASLKPILKDWVIVDKNYHIQYGSFIHKENAEQYAKGLETHRNLQCRVVSRNTFLEGNTNG